MRSYPETKCDQEELARLAPERWMVEQLKLNPSYVWWGPHEDYMCKEQGWDSHVIAESWPAFGPWGLDKYNEVVNFYFEVSRPSEPCATCGGNGYHPDAQWISESFYSHSSPFKKQTERELEAQALLTKFGCQFHRSVLGYASLPSEDVLTRYGKPFVEFCVQVLENGGHWGDSITEDEAQALVKAGRGVLDNLRTAEDFNRRQRSGKGTHDAINRSILTKQRCERLGIPLDCVPCEGRGDLFTGPSRLDLILWVIHPRKGASRGVEVQGIQQEELPKVYAYLREAAKRNAERFSGLQCA